MIKRLISFGLLMGVVVGLTGCCCDGGYHPLLFFPWTEEEISRCDNSGGCGGCGECATCTRPAPCRVTRCAARASCDTCNEGCETPCGGCGTCNTCRPRCYGPLSWIFDLLDCRTYPTSGCGERYWGEFYSDRPDLCDPCDNYGNYTGPVGRVSHVNSGVYEGNGYAPAPAHPGGCKSCQGNNTAVGAPLTPTPDTGAYIPRSSGAKQRTVAQRSTRPQYTSSSRTAAVARTAPRVVSDRVVKPADRATAQAEPMDDEDQSQQVPRLAAPRQKTVRQ